MDNTTYSLQYTDSTTTGTGWKFTSPSDLAREVQELNTCKAASVMGPWPPAVWGNDYGWWFEARPNKYLGPSEYSVECGLLPEKEDSMEVWEYVIVLLDEDDEKIEVKDSGFVTAKDRDRAIAKAAAENAIADNEMVLVRKFAS